MHGSHFAEDFVASELSKTCTRRSLASRSGADKRPSDGTISSHGIFLGLAYLVERETTGEETLRTATREVRASTSTAPVLSFHLQVHGPHDKPVQRCPAATASSLTCLRVRLLAERLSRTYPSDRKLQFGRGKKAFVFADGDGDEGIVFGSKEGEHCLLRVQIESSPAERLLPIEEILGVQMLYPSGVTMDLKMIKRKSSGDRREVVVLLKPQVLVAKVMSGSPENIDPAAKRDARFQLHVHVAVADSDKIVDIAKTVSWRTVSSARRSLKSAQGAKLEEVKCAPYVLRSGFLLFRTKAGRSFRRARNLSLAGALRRGRSPRSKTSWRASF